MEDFIKVNLPGAKLYKDECQLQTFTLNDARDIAIIQSTSDSKKLYDLIGRRMSMDVKALTLQDFKYVIAWQRINSYPTFPMVVPWECPHCKHNNIHRLEQRDLTIKPVDEQYEHYVRINLPSQPEPLPIRLQVVGDELLSRKYLKQIGVDNPSNKEMANMNLAQMLTAPDDTTGAQLPSDVMKMYTRIVKDFTAEDMYAVAAFEQAFDYGVSEVLNSTCDECGASVTVSYEINLMRFFPSFRDSFDIRTRILPRQASEPTVERDGESGLCEASVHPGKARPGVETLERAEA